MAVHTGRGIAAIEYPTGMNQNGDPSQAWIKVKPDGRIDVFAGTSDIGNGSKTIQSQIVAETIGVPYDWITYDNSNTDSSPVCTGTFASRATFVAGNAVQGGCEGAGETPRDRRQGARDRPCRPGDHGRRGCREGRAAEEDRRARRGRRSDVGTRRADHRHRCAAEAVRDDRRPGDRRVDLPPHSAISYAACAAEVEVDDETGVVTVGPALAVLRRRPRDQPDARRGADRGRRHAGSRARGAGELLPVLPVGRASRRAVRHLPHPRHGADAEDRHDHHREPLRRRPVRRQGDRRDGEQRPAAGHRGSRLRRRRRVGDRVADHPRKGAACPAGERGRATRGRRSSSTRHCPSMPSRAGACASRCPPDGADSPFRTWNGVESWNIFPTASIHAVGGDQVLLCRVVYEPGTTVQRHSHPSTEQVMWIIEGR